MNPTEWVRTVLERAELACRDEMLPDGRMVKVLLIVADEGDLDIEEIEELAQANLRNLANAVREVDTTST